MKTQLLRTIFAMAALFKTRENLNDYTVGDWDVRGWGHYRVTRVERSTDDVVTLCEKDICVFPKQMLSLQAHKGRDEIWTVTEGTLTVIVNGETKEIHAGESIKLKKTDIHCMINMTDKPVMVHEVQSGTCQESDNIRIMDFGGRKTEPYDHPQTQTSKDLYAQYMAQMPTGLNKTAVTFTNKMRQMKQRFRFEYRVA